MTDLLAHLQMLLDARHSCRAFRPDPVAEDVIERIVMAAGRAPSWCNAQPWQVTVTRGAETDRFRAALLDAVAHETPQSDLPWPESYPGAHGSRRRDCGLQLYEAVGITRSDRNARAEQSMRNYHLFGAPHVAILHSEAAVGISTETGRFGADMKVSLLNDGPVTIWMEG